ncbi:MAG TPA: ATP-binding protein, partial [Kofleriaceae bacterium]|nr:ATP-binding protein [Kofleriaceae bacterium]
MTTYRIRAIRLVNFHNFVDETIDVRDGGHLFLLGDNGSGKTTVLDAVHLVLAGGEPELNAAARVGGRREEGRTLQGIVLRFDRELGAIRHVGGAIAYAALELVDPDSGRLVSLGIGAGATTMEARVAKWGFLVNRPLAEVPLLDDARCPLDREALRGRLGANHVHATLTAYRKELARRLFGSEAQYDEAVRFWAMAKAYREIVAGARDFGALFERLLPAPDGGVFSEILRTLRAIDDLELALRDLDGQRRYVAGIAERVRDVAVAREAAARYRWLACHREREEALAEAARAEEDLTAAHRDAEGQRLEAERSRLRSEEADLVLRRATAEDSAGVLTMVRDAEARRRGQAVEAAQARAV